MWGKYKAYRRAPLWTNEIVLKIYGAGYLAIIFKPACGAAEKIVKNRGNISEIIKHERTKW